MRTFMKTTLMLATTLAVAFPSLAGETPKKALTNPQLANKFDKTLQSMVGEYQVIKVELYAGKAYEEFPGTPMEKPIIFKKTDDFEYNLTTTLPTKTITLGFKILPNQGEVIYSQKFSDDPLHNFLVMGRIYKTGLAFTYDAEQRQFINAPDLKAMVKEKASEQWELMKSMTKAIGVDLSQYSEEQLEFSQEKVMFDLRSGVIMFAIEILEKATQQPLVTAYYLYQNVTKIRKPQQQAPQ